jgi:phosphoribosylanthranilate isomerase
MSQFYRPRVKICCISNTLEAEMALAHGADVLGLVGPMPSGPGVISNAMIQQISWGVGPILTFLLTSETEPEQIIAHCRTAQTNCVQLVDAVDSAVYQQIRTALPYLKIVQVVHVTGQSSINEAQILAPMVDALLLDSGNPNLEVKELGGTGRVHNWEISREIVKLVDKPVFLAGGLNAENVREAIEVVRPYGLDVCSGVRTDGKLDVEKLGRFMVAVGAMTG